MSKKFSSLRVNSSRFGLPVNTNDRKALNIPNKVLLNYFKKYKATFTVIEGNYSPQILRGDRTDQNSIKWICVRFDEEPTEVGEDTIIFHLLVTVNTDGTCPLNFLTDDKENAGKQVYYKLQGRFLRSKSTTNINSVKNVTPLALVDSSVNGPRFKIYREMLKEYQTKIDGRKNRNKDNEDNSSETKKRTKRDDDDEVIIEAPVRGTVPPKKAASPELVIEVAAEFPELNFKVNEANLAKIAALKKAKINKSPSDLLIFDMEEIVAVVPATPTEMEILHRAEKMFYSFDHEYCETLRRRLYVEQTATIIEDIKKTVGAGLRAALQARADEETRTVVAKANADKVRLEQEKLEATNKMLDDINKEKTRLLGNIAEERRILDEEKNEIAENKFRIRQFKNEFVTEIVKGKEGKLPSFYNSAILLAADRLLTEKREEVLQKAVDVYNRKRGREMSATDPPRIIKERTISDGPVTPPLPLLAPSPEYVPYSGDYGFPSLNFTKIAEETIPSFSRSD